MMNRVIATILVLLLAPGCAVVPKDQLDSALAENAKQKQEIEAQRTALESARAHAEKLSSYIEGLDQIDFERDRMVSRLLQTLRQRGDR